MKTKKSKIDPFEYEDYGTPVMDLWPILVVVFMIAIIVLFGLIVLGGVAFISEMLR